MQVFIHSATVAAAAIASAAIIAAGGLPSGVDSGTPSAQGDLPIPWAAATATVQPADPFEQAKREAAEFELPPQF